MAVRVPMKGATLMVTISATPTAIPGVISIDDIGAVDTALVDVTAIDDPNTQMYKGMPDLGSLTFRIMFDPSDTTHLALFTQASDQAHATANLTTITATLANTAASIITCVGPLKMVGTKGGGPNDKYVADVSLKINSITRTP